MLRIDIVDDFACAPAALFALFLSDALEERVRASSSSRREDLPPGGGPGEVVRRTRIRPSRQLPSAIGNLLGPAGLSYVQTSRYDAVRNRVDWTIEVDRATDRVGIRGDVSLSDHPDGCRRTVTAEISVRLPVFGRTAEEHIAKEIRRTYARSAELLRALIAEGAA